VVKNLNFFNNRIGDGADILGPLWLGYGYSDSVDLQPYGSDMSTTITHICNHITRIYRQR